jgi:hypothetical protein
MKSKKDVTYYLIRDILSCFPDSVEKNLISVLHRHLISKNNIRDISLNEIKEEKPSFRILSGALIAHNNFLRQMPNVAFYETLDILEVLAYCFKKDRRKTLKRLSAQTILRLFASLYFEFIFLPLPPSDKSELETFKKTFSREDIVEVISVNDFYTRYIFENHRIDLGVRDEPKRQLKIILDEFYN